MSSHAIEVVARNAKHYMVTLDDEDLEHCVDASAQATCTVDGNVYALALVQQRARDLADEFIENHGHARGTPQDIRWRELTSKVRVFP